MRTTRLLIAACAALTAATGCDGSKKDNPIPTPTPQIVARLQGTWMECKAGTGSNLDVMTFDDLNLNVTPVDFTSSDCTGEGTPRAANEGTIVAGADVSANLGAVAVTATQLDIVFSGGTQYTLGYVDTETTPRRFYLGDDTGANDGSTAALRPTALDATRYLTMGGPYETLLKGAWTTCKTGAGYSNLDTLTFSGLTVSRTGNSYTTEDCTGTPTVMPPGSGTIVLGAAVATTLDTIPVTAIQLDVSMGGTDYTLGYVDFATDPDRLYMGTHTPPNDGSTPALRPTTLDGTRYFTRQ